MKVERIILVMLVAMLHDSQAYRNNQAALDLTADVLRNSGRFGHSDLRRHIQRGGTGAVHHNRNELSPLHRTGRHALKGHSRRPEGGHSKKAGLKHRKRHSKSRKAPISCAERISRLMKELSDSSKYEAKLSSSMDSELSHPMVDHDSENAGSTYNEVFEDTAKIDAITCDSKKYHNLHNSRLHDDDGMMNSHANMADRHFRAYNNNNNNNLNNNVNKRFALNENLNPNKAAMERNAPYIYSTWERVPERRAHPEETDKLKKEEVAMKYWRDHMAIPGRASFVGKFESQEQRHRQSTHDDQPAQNYHWWPHYDSKYYRHH